MSTKHLLEAQKLAPDTLVHLYQINLDKYGGGTLYWTPGPISGQGGNLIPNPCFTSAPDPWNFGGGTPANVVGNSGGVEAILKQVGINVVSAALPVYINQTDGSVSAASRTESYWSIKEYGSGFMARNAGFPAGSYMDCAGAQICLGGQPVQFQAMVMPVNCAVYLGIEFQDNNNNVIQTVQSGVIDSGQYGSFNGSTNPALYAQLFVNGWAPAGTDKITYFIRAIPNAQSSYNNYVFMSKTALYFTNYAPSVALPWIDVSNIGSVVYGGATYQPVPLQLTGMQMTTQGALPRPVISIPNLNGFASQIMASYNDMLGATVTRYRTFRRHLDNGTDPDDTAYFGPDIFYIDRKSAHTNESVSFELAASLDIQGKQLPGRQVIRDVCTHTYRYWNAATSTFTPGSCPYAGSNYWIADGTPTGDPSLDDCGRRLSDCSLRFPDGTLYTRAFPGVSKVGT